MNEWCGTYTGYQHHNKRGTPVCERCRQARKEYRFYLNQRRETYVPKPAQSGIAFMGSGDATYPDPTQALCAQANPEQWFPDQQSAANRIDPGAAKKICRQCPVVDDCLNWALTQNEEYGIWGGTSQSERREIKRNARKLAS